MSDTLAAPLRHDPRVKHSRVLVQAEAGLDEPRRRHHPPRGTRAGDELRHHSFAGRPVAHVQRPGEDGEPLPRQQRPGGGEAGGIAREQCDPAAPAPELAGDRQTDPARTSRDDGKRFTGKRFTGERLAGNRSAGEGRIIGCRPPARCLHHLFRSRCCADQPLARKRPAGPHPRTMLHSRNALLNVVPLGRYGCLRHV